ncbi:MAG: hypothetical protein LBS36_01995 [Oscillospiraceae bacterium]|nr:hypothetical protein [Oscillospiraceae bacterium]
MIFPKKCNIKMLIVKETYTHQSYTKQPEYLPQLWRGVALVFKSVGNKTLPPNRYLPCCFTFYA